jgi:catechol 2,3-dioxygenase-like lactoylglutathione lyase family enzyme
LRTEHCQRKIPGFAAAYDPSVVHSSLTEQVLLVRVTEIIADLHVADIETAKEFYSGYLGLSNEEFNLGWVARLTSPDTGVNVQLVTRDATAAEDPVISVRVDDVDAAYQDARQRGYEIVHQLCTEPWGIRRFFVRAPDGNVLNIVQHRD